MAVNGIEIEVGQKWVCRDGEVREIVSFDDNSSYPFGLNDGECVTYFGKVYTDGDTVAPEDLISISNIDHSYDSEEKQHSHYFKNVSHLTHIDVYRVLELFNVTDPCLQHAVKKLLCAGGRGAKDFEKDVREAGDSIARKLEMIAEDAKKD